MLSFQFYGGVLGGLDVRPRVVSDSIYVRTGRSHVVSAFELPPLRFFRV